MRHTEWTPKLYYLPRAVPHCVSSLERGGGIKCLSASLPPNPGSMLLEGERTMDPGGGGGGIIPATLFIANPNLYKNARH